MITALRWVVEECIEYGMLAIINQESDIVGHQDRMVAECDRYLEQIKCL